MRRGLLTLMLVAGSFMAVGPTIAFGAGRSSKADLDAWRHIPVYHNGRIMPLDTYARLSTEVVCGRTNPTISPPAEGIEETDGDAWKALFPAGEARKWQASELLLSWLVEPERWEDVPFLPAKHEELRRDVLDIPLKDAKGDFLAGVSPRTLQESEGFQRRIMEIVTARRDAAAAGKEYQPSAVEKKVEELFRAHGLYRELMFDPRVGPGAQRQLRGELKDVVDAWVSIDTRLKESEIGSVVGSALVGAANQPLLDLYQFMDEAPQSLQRQDVAEKLDALVKASASAHSEMVKLAARLETSPPETISPEQVAELRKLVAELEPATQAMALQSANMALVLFADSDGLCVIPALNPDALEADRDQDEEPEQPWLDLQAVLMAPEVALGEYPQAEIKAVRSAFAKMSERFDGRYTQSAAFDSSQREFAAALHELGTALEPTRQKLYVRDRDEAMMAYTAYPPATATDAEVRYNTLDPFMWSWVVGLVALCFYSLSFGRIRTVMYWLGSAVLLCALVWTAYGFQMRIVISGWAPVTNMYETVIYVPFVVGVLGFCFAFAPMLGPGWRNAWRLTAVPGTWEATELGDDNLRLLSHHGWSLANLVLLLPRLALAALTLMVLAVRPYAAGGRTIVDLLPNTEVGASLPNMNDAMVWVVGLMVLVPAVWYLPRAILTALAAPLAIPLSVRRRYNVVWPQVLRRRPFAISATMVATVCWIVAWYSPVLDPNFKPLMPVLRDNFWLLIHVLTIVASYGAGALAWGLGNISLGYYLFGQYRQPAVADGLDAAFRGTTSSSNGSSGGLFVTAPQRMRPPEACAAQAGYTYKAIQVAVVLLAAGTILGALWADVAWGRFWGWDPKEVWALISLLVYLAILHGRYAGITGNFGLAVGSVMGATAILMSWYGVNFVLGAGLHSYGFGESAQGQIYVGSCILANWLFVGVAAARYFATTSSGSNPPLSASATSGARTVVAAKVEEADSEQTSKEAVTS